MEIQNSIVQHHYNLHVVEGSLSLRQLTLVSRLPQASFESVSFRAGLKMHAAKVGTFLASRQRLKLSRAMPRSGSETRENGQHVRSG